MALGAQVSESQPKCVRNQSVSRFFPLLKYAHFLIDHNCYATIDRSWDTDPDKLIFVIMGDAEMGIYFP